MKENERQGLKQLPPEELKVELIIKTRQPQAFIEELEALCAEHADSGNWYFKFE